MVTKITNAALIAACEQMLTENIKYTTLDCQAAVEEAYRRAGLALKSVDESGSNTHYRECYWKGTPERLLDILGIKEVPAGVETYINADDGGEPTKYQNDGMGNTSHMGVYLGNGRTFNSSEKMKGVVVSEKFNGKKKAVSGSWNMIGFKDYVDYGLTAAQLAILANDGNFNADKYSGSFATSDAGGTQSTTETVATTAIATIVDTSGFYTVKKGCKGGAVERLQTWLARDLGYGISVDHDFGPATEAAVIAFQTDHALEADGIVGQKTWAALAQARYDAHKDGVSG